MKLTSKILKNHLYCDIKFSVRKRKLLVSFGSRRRLTKRDLLVCCRYYWDKLNNSLYGHDVYRLPFDWQFERSYSHDTYHDLACYLYTILRDLEIVDKVPYPHYSRHLSEFDIIDHIYPDTLLKPKCINLDIEVCKIRDHSRHLLGYVPVLDSLALHAFRSVTELRNYLYSLYPLTQYKINLLIN